MIPFNPGIRGSPECNGPLEVQIGFFRILRVAPTQLFKIKLSSCFSGAPMIALRCRSHLPLLLNSPFLG